MAADSVVNSVNGIGMSDNFQKSLGANEHSLNVVLGTQWGDEGKGKLVDLLANDANIVCRCQVSRRTTLPCTCCRCRHYSRRRSVGV